jgi:hypothetical protein
VVVSSAKELPGPLDAGGGLLEALTIRVLPHRFENRPDSILELGAGIGSQESPPFERSSETGPRGF